MQGLYDKLRAIGLSTPYVRKRLLPDWWDDAAATSPAGFTEAVWILARHLGVDAIQLRDHATPVRLLANDRVHFKLRGETEPASVSLARSLAEQVARFVLLGAPPRGKDAPRDPLAIRARILETGAPWVGFAHLLDFCWGAGIPVAHIAELPASTKKMDGMAVSIAGRPAIVLTSRRRHASWQLFLLAHELGHVCCGHLDDGGTFVDVDVDEDSEDPREREANAFALALITGDAKTRVVPKARWPKADALAEAAQQLGRQRAVDPGHIVLNYAHSMATGSFWGVANAALKLIRADGDPAAMIRERMAATLDWSNLPTEAAEFVARMTGPDANTQP
ncbi:MAG: ImmA/IrrE family metallo-endopeptidase [Planctomycetota bacterium]